MHVIISIFILENGTKTYHINEKAICRAKISQLLRAAVKFEYDIFERTLQQILPIGVEFKVILYLPFFYLISAYDYQILADIFYIFLS